MNLQKNSARSILDSPLLHPLLIALFPVLSLWLANFDQVEAAAVVRPALYSLVVGIIAFLAGLGIFLRLKKAALFASLFLVLFFTYGQVFQLIDMKSVSGVMVGRHRYLIPLWLGLFALGGLLIWRARQALAPATRILNLAGLFLFLLCAGQLAFLAAASRAVRPAATVAGQDVQAGSVQAGDILRRDVYVIVMDGYARQDVLASQHGVDNAAFLQELRDLGFVVMDCAQSNYGYTPLSIAALLNMNYIDDMGFVLDPEAKSLSFWDYKGAITNSLVQQKLVALGYRTAAFKPLYPWMDAPDSDDYFDVEKSSGFFDKQASINFQYLFQHTTAMRLVMEVEQHSPDPFNKLPPWLVRIINPKGTLLSNSSLKQYEQSLFALDTLANAADIPGPKFFYAHLFITHRPYIFRPDGSLRWPVEGTIEAYNDQVLFVNNRLAGVLKQMIAEATVPPVIVLLSDHGYSASAEERMKILSAYYLPDGGAEQLYPTITPVNTFRLIFSHYFGEKLPFLDDRSFYSPIDYPGRLEEIPISCPAEK